MEKFQNSSCAPSLQNNVLYGWLWLGDCRQHFVDGYTHSLTLRLRGNDMVIDDHKNIIFFANRDIARETNCVIYPTSLGFDQTNSARRIFDESMAQSSTLPGERKSLINRGIFWIVSNLNQ